MDGAGQGYQRGYVSFDSNAEKVEAIAKVFPIFFFLVAALDRAHHRPPVW